MKHLLIDFENIQPQNLDNLPTEDTHIWLFLGVVHKHLPIELVQSLLRFGERAHLIRLEKSGKNALDFYLSYYLGQITATDPQANIGILSRDGGYDILVEHIIQNQHAQSAIRLATLDEVQTPKKIMKQNESIVPLTEKVNDYLPNETIEHKPLLPFFQAALNVLRHSHDLRAKNLQNLKSNLHNILHDLLLKHDETEKDLTVQKVINKLKNQNLILINDEELITYQLDDADILIKIQRYILNTKPETFADFHTKVKERAEILCLKVDEGDIQAFAKHLREQNLIRQNNGKIEYPPFSEPKPQIEPKSYKPNEKVWQVTLSAISLNPTKRPKKVSTLKNHIKSHTECSDQEIELLFQYLQNKKYIEINNTKLVYLK